MRITLSTLLLLVAAALPPPSFAAPKRAAVEFREYCEQTSTRVSNPQARWNCTARNYESLSRMQASLDERNPRSEWRTPFWRKNEPVLAKLQGKETFWDCVPDVDTCGIWVKLSSTQFVFIQQLLDRQAGNAWLGIGLTLFCEGARAACRKAQERVAGLLPAGDLGETSLVGTPPPAPPLPPPPSL